LKVTGCKALLGVKGLGSVGFYLGDWIELIIFPLFGILLAEPGVEFLQGIFSWATLSLIDTGTEYCLL